MKRYAVLNYGDKKKELRSAMKVRLGNNIYLTEVYDTKADALRNRGAKKAISPAGRYDFPIGILEDVEILPSAYYKAKLIEVEY